MTTSKRSAASKKHLADKKLAMRAQIWPTLDEARLWDRKNAHRCLYKKSSD